MQCTWVHGAYKCRVRKREIRTNTVVVHGGDLFKKIVHKHLISYSCVLGSIPHHMHQIKEVGRKKDRVRERWRKFGKSLDINFTK